MWPRSRLDPGPDPALAPVAAAGTPYSAPIAFGSVRHHVLGCNGGTLSRTPAVDGLAAAGHRYERAHPQSVVCMPSRSTMLTGQHPSTHGVWMNGVTLPVDAPSVAERTITREAWVCTPAGPGTQHDGSEGELYDLGDDPLQRVNRWADPALTSLRSDLLADLHDHQPAFRLPRRRVEAPV